MRPPTSLDVPQAAHAATAMAAAIVEAAVMLDRRSKAGIHTPLVIVSRTSSLL